MTPGFKYLVQNDYDDDYVLCNNEEELSQEVANHTDPEDAVILEIPGVLTRVVVEKKLTFKYKLKK